MKLSKQEIAAKDLRVGNRLNKDGIVVCIDARSILDISYNDSEACKYKPIPLTPEILERCGFVNNIVYRLTIANKDSSPSELQWSGGETICICRSGINAIGVSCKYVHQLQNLYYSLTGEELDLGIAISKNEVK